MFISYVYAYINSRERPLLGLYLYMPTDPVHIYRRASSRSLHLPATRLGMLKSSLEGGTVSVITGLRAEQEKKTAPPLNASCFRFRHIQRISAFRYTEIENKNLNEKVYLEDKDANRYGRNQKGRKESQ